jgi:hypothetical protein
VIATAAAALGEAGFDWDECMILLDFEEFVEALLPAFFAEDSFAAGPARFLLDQLIDPVYGVAGRRAHLFLMTSVLSDKGLTTPCSFLQASANPLFA